MAMFPRTVIQRFVSLLICFLLGAEGQFDGSSGDFPLLILPSQNTLLVESRTSVYLKCKPHHRVERNQITDLKWTGPNGEDISDNQKARVIMERDEHGIGLFIQSIQKEDTGVYNCSGRYQNTWVTTGTTIEIYTGITFEDAPSVQYATLGEEGIIKCVVRSEPPAYVSWLKNWARLRPGDSNRVSFNPGQIKFNPVVKEDDGTYKCQAAVHETGEIEEKTIQFKVYVPPGHLEDDEMKIECASPVDQGATHGTDSNAFSGNIYHSLIINKTWFDHASKATCVTRRETAEVSYVLNLEKVMKPKMIRCDDITVREGQTAALQCEVSGDPLPEVTVQRFNNETMSTEDLQTQDSRISLDVADDNSVRKATLTIQNVSSTDDGLYVWTANNKGGRVTTYARINVNYPPVFKDPVIHFWSWINHKVNLTCVAEASPEAIISWVYRDSSSEERPAEDLVGNVIRHGLGSTSYLEVMPVDETFFRIYTCIAANKLGQTRYNIELKEAATVPDAVNAVMVFKVKATSVSFMILEGDDNGGLPVDAYVVQYKEQDEDWNENKQKIWPVNASYSLDALKPLVTYMFRFAARNAVGLGPFGEPLVKTMYDDDIPKKPAIDAKYPDQKVVQDIDTATSYELEWLESERDNYVDYYLIRVWEVDEELQENTGVEEVTYEIDLKGNLMFDINLLKPGHIYKVEVVACNELGCSAPSIVYIRTSAD